MLRPPFDYILSYDPLLQLTIYPDPLLPFTLFFLGSTICTESEGRCWLLLHHSAYCVMNRLLKLSAVSCRRFVMLWLQGCVLRMLFCMSSDCGFALLLQQASCFIFYTSSTLHSSS
jgi:hypothetical protein